MVCRTPQDAAAVSRMLEKDPPNDKARFFDYSINKTGRSPSGQYCVIPVYIVARSIRGGGQGYSNLSQLADFCSQPSC